MTGSQALRQPGLLLPPPPTHLLVSLPVGAQPGKVAGNWAAGGRGSFSTPSTRVGGCSKEKDMREGCDMDPPPQNANCQPLA